MDADDTKNTKKIRTLTMRIDRNLCIGAATCIAIAPKAWALDNEAKAIILDTADAENDETLIAAAKGCQIGRASCRERVFGFV
jgi:ferredoxin